MSIQEWILILGLVTSCAIPLGRWMFMVHAQLAVIAAEAAELCDKMERAAEAQQELWAFYMKHEARLDAHDVQISYLNERIKDACVTGQRSR